MRDPVKSVKKEIIVSSQGPEDAFAKKMETIAVTAAVAVVLTLGFVVGRASKR
jgi:hypothetical protein